MKIQLTITALADRDPSCNLLTMTQVFLFDLAAAPQAAAIKGQIKIVKDQFRAMWPHNQICPTLIPIDVHICEINTEGQS